MRRALVALLTLAASARADPARDCYLKTTAEEAPPPLEPVGCFGKVRATEEHAYGLVVCLYLEAGGCAGMLYRYDPGPEPDWIPLDDATCRGGAVSFTASRRFRVAYTEVGPVPDAVSFEGRIRGRTLRGKLREAGADPRAVSLPRWRRGLAPAEQWQRRRQLARTEACLAGR